MPSLKGGQQLQRMLGAEYRYYLLLAFSCIFSVRTCCITSTGYVLATIVVMEAAFMLLFKLLLLQYSL
jgi:hypothetical protein